ncbi:MAG TPA: phosphatidylserine decarboxylase family protein [Prolixibacteraceae bacterium]|nr:phosphatidylserine decarboxylase family protein [Prolixibacteraceae bacterium]
MKIHKEGYKVIPVVLLIIAILDLLIWFLLNQFIIGYLLIATSVVLAGLVVYFFRVPKRSVEQNPLHVIAPADGKIVEIKEVFEKEYFKDNRIQVSIFMSPLNVHQNKGPVSGVITYLKHHRGAFYPAFVEKSSELNERCSIVFKTENGTEVLSRQIAGTVARRICFYVKPGDKIEQGDEYGFIRFGSRVDVFLPLTAKVTVEMDVKTVGGKTVIATL